MNKNRARVYDTLEQKLTEAFAPDYLEIIDESEQHRGHGGWREGGETHFRIVMKSAALNELSRVQRSRSVHRVLEAELQDRIHALSLDLSGT
ncbi:BolA family protein [Amaricoccus tamworthensis]|uniref:BolA family protein n=1 Tax=Amaricoccus tamworthensis TaxID=57002 RepID=UPI003C7B6532